MSLTNTLPSTVVTDTRAPRWVPVFLLVYGAWVILPWVAPVLMHYGRSDVGKAIYFVYSLFCHQLPERSFFLFGPQSMYSLSDVQTAWQDTLNPMVLRQFAGNDLHGLEGRLVGPDGVLLHQHLADGAGLVALPAKDAAPAVVGFCSSAACP